MTHSTTLLIYFSKVPTDEQLILGSLVTHYGLSNIQPQPATFLHQKSFRLRLIYPAPPRQRPRVHTKVEVSLLEELVFEHCRDGVQFTAPRDLRSNQSRPNFQQSGRLPSQNCSGFDLEALWLDYRFPAAADVKVQT